MIECNFTLSNHVLRMTRFFRFSLLARRVPHRTYTTLTRLTRVCEEAIIAKIHTIVRTLQPLPAVDVCEIFHGVEVERLFECKP